MRSVILIFSLFVFLQSSFSQNISPYFGLGAFGNSIDESSQELKKVITAAGYEVLGEYSPGNQSDLYVVAFTNAKTKEVCENSANQGLIASPYRLTLEKTSQGIELSSVNPEYQWRAYLTEGFSKNQDAFDELKVTYMRFLKSLGTPTPFGGEEDAEDLEDYHYMMGMPYYEDQVDLKTFDSYQSAINAIEKNLGSTNGFQLVYTIKNDSKQIAIYGVGLIDSEIGEKHFLSIIGQKHAAALPYELIVEGNEVKMLHGRFRFALYWPELTMTTFTKIMSTPGDVEDMMKKLVE